MNNSDFNEFYPQLSQKGYTQSELRTTLTRKVGGELTADPILEDGSNCYWYNQWIQRLGNQFDTYADYLEKLDEGLNGGF
jgi:hypothetical protein